MKKFDVKHRNDWPALSVGAFSLVRCAVINFKLFELLLISNSSIQTKPKKEAALVTSLFLGQAVFWKTIILINSSNGLQVPEPKAGRPHPGNTGFSSVYLIKGFWTAGVICRTATGNIGKVELGYLNSTL